MDCSQETLALTGFDAPAVKSPPPITDEQEKFKQSIIRRHREKFTEAIEARRLKNARHYLKELQQNGVDCLKEQQQLHQLEHKLERLKEQHEEAIRQTKREFADALAQGDVHVLFFRTSCCEYMDILNVEPALSSCHHP